ncbi:MAG: oligosaccharide flippase family protein [Lentilitoribacter sp.]
MTSSIVTLLEKLLPEKLGNLILPKVLMLFAILANKDGDKNAERTALVAFSIRIISAALAFVSQIILARLMGEFEYGIFVFVWVFIILAGNLSCLGFHTVVIKFVPEYNAHNDPSHIRGLTITARIFALILATIIGAIGVIVVVFFADKIPNYYLVPAILGICALPMIALGDVLDGTSRANSWPIIAMSPTFIIRPALIIIFVLGAFLYGLQPTAKIALMAAIFASYMTTLGQFIVVTRKLRNRYETGERHWELKKWITVALPIFIIEGFYYLLTNADVIIVGFYLEPEKVAVYFAAAKTMALVHFIYFAVKAGASPKFASMVAENKTTELDNFAKQTARWTLIPTLLIGGLVLLLGRFLLSMFGESFIDGHIVMIILFFGILAKSFIGPGEMLLTMAGKQKICMIVYAGALAANLVLNITLIPMFGIQGAAFATAGAMTIEAILLFFVIKSQLGITMFALGQTSNNDDETTLSPSREVS